MTRDELRQLTDKLGAVHYWLHHTPATKEFNPRQIILDAIRELTLFQLREEAALKLISEMETRGVRLREQIAHLEHMLNGKEETVAAVAAQAIGRGVDEAELKEG